MTDKIKAEDILLIENILTLYKNKVMGSEVAQEEWTRIDYIIKSLPHILDNQEKAKRYDKLYSRTCVDNPVLRARIYDVEQQNKKLQGEVRQLKEQKEKIKFKEKDYPSEIGDIFRIGNTDD